MVGPHIPKGKTPYNQRTMGRGGAIDYTVALAEVVRVDNENFQVDLVYLTRTGRKTDVPITAAYWSKRGFLGAVPAVGSLCLVSFAPSQEGKGAAMPYIVGFLSNGYKSAKNFDPVRMLDPNDPEFPINTATLKEQLEGYDTVTRHRIRKLYEGDVFGCSDQGAEMLLTKDVLLSNNLGVEFALRSADASSALSTGNIFEATFAGRGYNGRIQRPSLVFPFDFFGSDGKIALDHPAFDLLVENNIIDSEGNPRSRVDDPDEFPSILMSNGQKIYIPTQGGGNADLADDATRVYTENRIEVRHTSDQVIPVTEFTDGFDSDRAGSGGSEVYKPFIERVYGTLVGNEPFTDLGRIQYGEILRAQVFSDPINGSPDPSLEIVDSLLDPGLADTIATAFLHRMERPDGGGQLFFSHDKEGYTAVHIPASSDRNPQGAGRSADVGMQGSLKLHLGQNSIRNSLELFTTGKLDWRIGKDIDGDSAKLHFGGKLEIMVFANNKDGEGYRREIVGNSYIHVTQNENRKIDGGVNESTEGEWKLNAETHSIETSKHINRAAGGDYNLTISGAQGQGGRYNAQINSSRKVTINGSGGSVDELSILTGNRKNTLTAGNWETILTAGDYKTTIVSGNITETVTSGDKTTTLASGKYTVTANNGLTLFTAQSASITAGTSMSLTASTEITMTAPSVKIGPAAGPFGVVVGTPGPGPHLDSLTGEPLTGSNTVKASL